MRTKSFRQRTIFKKNVSVVTQPAEASETKPKSGVFNVLIMGTDQRPEDPAGHSDSMILLHMNLDKKSNIMQSVFRVIRVCM
ncbi:hypothetical protein GCM10020331_046820 [Ectobacillus funiculus]